MLLFFQIEDGVGEGLADEGEEFSPPEVVEAFVENEIVGDAQFALAEFFAEVR